MENHNNTLDRLAKILEVYKFGLVESENDEYYILQNIISDSSQAIRFVTVIEDEFEIEFTDDEIDLDFFSSLKTIAAIIDRHRIIVE